MTDLIEALADRLKANPDSIDVMGNAFRARPPAPESAIADAETALGHGLPPLLRTIYRTVANGGFGPGYGILGVDGGFPDDQRMTIVDRYRSFCETDPHDPTWQWDAAWLPFCHWGCGIYSVAILAPPYPIFYIDPGNKDEGAPMASVVTPHKPSIEAFFTDWLAGGDLWGEIWG